MNKENLLTDNWYYVMAMGDIPNGGLKHVRTICFALDKKGAEKRAMEWAAEQECNRQVYLYHKNYKIEAKKMVADGNYIIANLTK